MTECEKLRNDLKAFLDGQLSPAARIALRLHLNRCESCRKEIEEMRLLGTNMRTADSLEMSDALRSRILASVPTTAQPATVKMLPKWREKPVLIWGASASAVLAWFVLYPAMNDYQNHVSRSAKATSNTKQIGMAMQQYTQDYDEGRTGAADGLPSGVTHSGLIAGQHYYAGGKNDVIPSWMLRRQIPASLQIQAGNGRALGDSAVTRQTELLTKTDPTQQFSSTPAPASDEKYIYFDSDRISDTSGAAVKPYAPKPLSSDGATSTVQDGDGSVQKQIPVPDGYQVTHGNMRIGGDITAGNGHAVRKWVFPRTFDLQDGVVSDGHVRYGAPLRYNGNAPIQIAQNTKNGKYETIETDSSRSGQSQSATVAAPQDTMHIGRGYYLQDDLPTERQVHKDASLTVEVANAEQQSEAVERLVKESKGYVAQNQLTTVDDGTRQASLTCKVPVDQFDTVMGQLARLGLLKGKTLSGEDITDKVSDEQETGHVLRADIATTEEKLKERKRHSDAVRDEETLRQLRIRVAQSQARLKMLAKLGALSEITVELDEKPKNAAPEVVKPANPFMEEVSGTGQVAAHSFLMALRLPVQLLVWIVVYSPLWALLYFGYRRMTR